ncbi:hypothetical protein XH84_10495 [Bradyrhizobium nanningense]|nr:hypothetical protein XH84_10495 [Bradyrhizobium nanningense]
MLARKAISLAGAGKVKTAWKDGTGHRRPTRRDRALTRRLHATEMTGVRLPRTQTGFSRIVEPR